MANTQEYEKYFTAIYILGCIFLALNLYYYATAVFARMGLVAGPVVEFFGSLKKAGLFTSMFKTKAWSYVLIVVASIPRTGKRVEMEFPSILLLLLVGTILFFIPTGNAYLYILTSILGLLGTTWGAELLGRKLKDGGFNPAKNDLKETFDQCRDYIENDLSINIPTKFQYQGKQHDGWLNIVAPQRGLAIYGIPGSGKTFSIYGPVIETMIQKNYAIFLYDFKFPGLTELVYNEMLLKYKDKPEDQTSDGKVIKRPSFYVINYGDPRRSHRCNPISTKYLKSSLDTAEKAEVIMNNLCPGQKDNKKDFFDMSAESYSDINLDFLRVFEGGIHCNFPMFIELMSQNYEDLLVIFDSYPHLKTRTKPFINALRGGANEQLQGQIASAQVPLSKLASPELYWVMSGDDFTLDVNDPNAPKIICIGNDPDRQAVYSTANALYTTQSFKLINHPNKRHCGVLLDELPTMYVKGLDQLVNTARENKVVVCFAAQDKSQLVRDYGKEYADVIFNTIGNIFFGAVRGETAKEFSNSFGKEFRRQESQTQSIDSESVNVSYHQEEILPINVIETLSVGYFGGVIADDYGYEIDKKYFLARIMRDPEKIKEKKSKFEKLPELTDFHKKELFEYIDSHQEETLLHMLKSSKELAEEISRRGIEPSETKMSSEARKVYDSMTEAERKARIESYKEEAYDDLVQEVIQENFKAIKREAEEIISKEFKRLGKKPKGVLGQESQAVRTQTEIEKSQWISKRAQDLWSKAS